MENKGHDGMIGKRKIEKIFRYVNWGLQLHGILVYNKLGKQSAITVLKWAMKSDTLCRAFFGEKRSQIQGGLRFEPL